ncbi:hypothetical protein [Paractinoplanes atraurantiacus]|uniref:Uncharacterized protein n=1 Tax=Paractinoplanes atraurantiacus TaxID=1036182 RepID=A0A285J9V3_9ACTN|nr:hypothetical protein [Actinoplanes atraurantiacus]SNY57014.1 hypothetical protein SAMN05421748_11843 [Actinoplanes atraurantiacus]
MTRAERARSLKGLAVVDGYRFPAGVRHRFTAEHGDLDTAGVALVEDATRQWFRLAVRRPRARLSMPSVAVGDLWHEMTLDTRGYAEFCEATLGYFLPCAPEQARTHLAETFHLAQRDESCGPETLPLLFRVDQQLKIKNGHHYLADCGGRGVCHELPGAICLRHVAGTENPKRWRPNPRRDSPVVDDPTIGGGGN